VQRRSRGSEGKKRRSKISEYVQLQILSGGSVM
jgi:hypothetical protein